MFFLKSSCQYFTCSLRIILCLIACLILFFSPTLFAQDCDAALENALESFGQQRYNLIISLLTDCPPGGFPDKAKKIMAYELLAQAYFFINQVDSVKSCINELIDLQPGYVVQPPQYPEEFIKIVDEIKKERARQEPKSIFRNKWFYIGSGTILATAMTAAIVYGSGGSDGSGGKAVRLPDPPAFPIK